MLAGIAVLAPMFAGRAVGQEIERYQIKDAREISAEEFGFDLPDGRLRQFKDLRLATTDEEGRGCVAEAYVGVGENYIVRLPDGQLVARKANQCSPTERPFEPLTTEAMAKQLTSGRLKGFETLETEHFVFVFNTTPDFAKVTSTVMESMLKGVIKYCGEQGLEVGEPTVPLTVIMFRHEEQFQAYKPMPPGVLAYYEITTNRVVLHEDSQFTGIDNDLARQDLLSTIAHEGAHQILHNIGVQQRLSRWPLWLGEGIAEYLAPTKPGRRFAWKGAGKINDLRMYELEGFLQQQFIKGFDGDTVNQTVLAGALDSTGYASAWTLTHYLAEKHEEDFDRYMRYLSRMPPLQGMLPDAEARRSRQPGSEPPTVPGNMVHFKKFFSEDLNAFENEMVEFMAKENYDPPFGGVPHLVCTALIPGVDGETKYVCFYPFFDEGNIKSWQAAVFQSLNEYEKENAVFEMLQFKDRDEANRYIKKWKRGR